MKYITRLSSIALLQGCDIVSMNRSIRKRQGVYLAEVGSVYDVSVKYLRHKAVVPPVIVFVLREGVDWLNGWELLFLGAG